MQLNLDITVLSEQLYQRVRAYFSAGSDASSHNFQAGDLTFRYGDGRGEGARESILMAEDYDSLLTQRGAYAQLLWLNPSGALASDEMPQHDLDLMDLSQLPRLAGITRRPTLAQCLAWWEVWMLPENIRRHVTQVASAAYKLAMWMRNQGIDVDPILTHRAALSHDLDKIQTLHQPGRHGLESAEFLNAQGYPELARIVEQHLLGVFLYQDSAALSWETKLVNFCDKLVEGDQIVPLPDRFAALKQRYPGSHRLIDESEPYLWRLNDEICAILSVADHGALVADLNR